MARSDRSDQTVGAHEKKHKLPKGTVRNPDGSKPRSDKTLGELRKKKKQRARHGDSSTTPP